MYTQSGDYTRKVTYLTFAKKTSATLTSTEKDVYACIANIFGYGEMRPNLLEN